MDSQPRRVGPHHPVFRHHPHNSLAVVEVDLVVLGEHHNSAQQHLTTLEDLEVVLHLSELIQEEDNASDHHNLIT